MSSDATYCNTSSGINMYSVGTARVSSARLLTYCTFAENLELQNSCQVPHHSVIINKNIAGCNRCVIQGCCNV